MREGDRRSRWDRKGEEGRTECKKPATHRVVLGLGVDSGALVEKKLGHVTSLIVQRCKVERKVWSLEETNKPNGDVRTAMGGESNGTCASNYAFTNQSLDHTHANHSTHALRENSLK